MQAQPAKEEPEPVLEEWPEDEEDVEGLENGSDGPDDDLDGDDMDEGEAEPFFWR